MSVSTLLHKQYAALASRWPQDALRPTLSFPETLRLRMAHYFNSTPLDTTTPNSPASPANPTLSTIGLDADSLAAAAGSGAKGKVDGKLDPEAIKAEMNAIAGLLENRYKVLYPVGEGLMRPRGNPEYYERLRRELEVAPERGMVGKWAGKLKGWVRMG